MRRYLLLIFVFGINTLLLAQEWELAKSKDQIDVYTKKFENSPFKAFKAITTIDASVDEIEKVLLNFEDFPNWVFKCYKSNIVKKINQNEFLVHQYMETPWPVTNRDMVLNYKLESKQDKSIINITCNSKAVENDDDCLRIEVAEGKWELIRIDDNKTKIIYQFLADPNGSLPSFMVNMFVVEGPIETINGLKKKL